MPGIETYFGWRNLNRSSAEAALNDGASFFEIPVTFGDGVDRYSHGLRTKRGTYFLVSDAVLAEFHGLVFVKNPLTL